MDAAALVQAIAAELRDNPPTIGIIGLSGVGKSSTINAMFGTDLPVSATTRGTTRFIESRIRTPDREVFGVTLEPAIHVLDAPGLGEDTDLDEKYKRHYRRHLRKCDAVIWVIAARNRALALDQQYLKSLRNHLPTLVLGINQIDLVDPIDWNEGSNMPSGAQQEAIARIVEDRREKLARFFNKPLDAVAYSAERYFGLHDLFLRCIHNVPQERRWMFEVVRAFSAEDWLARARGLTDDQRASIVERFRRKTDRPAGLEALLEKALASR